MRNQLFVAFLLLFSALGYSQEEYELPGIVTPSPTAFEFAQHGNIPLNGSTGGFSYQVPLFQLNEGDIQINTSLNYFSSGVKIDKLSTEVGVDWTLNAGGVITRIIHDDPDEEVQYRWYPESINPVEDYANIKAAARDDSHNFDTEPDWFSFNVNGISGEFYLDENLDIQVNSESNIIITKNSDFTTFEIVDEKGFKYSFGGSNAIETNFSSNDCDRSSRTISKTSWFLNKITSPKGNIITFQYKSSSYQYISAIGNTLIFDEDCYCGPSNTTYTYNHSKCISHSNISTKLISKIIGSNGYIEFQYDSGRPDVMGQTGDILQKITKYSTNKELDSYDLVYEETVSNNHIDSDLASFESLKYRFYLSEIIHSDSLGQDSSKYQFEYEGKEDLPCRLSYSQDIYGYHNNTNNYKAFANPKDADAYAVASNYASFLIGADKDVTASFTHYGMMSKIYYPTKGETIINYEANSDTDFVESDVTQSNSINLSKGCGEILNESESFTFTSNGSPINYFVNATIDTYICNSERDALHDKYYVQIRDLTTGNDVRNFSRPEGNYIATDSYLDCSNVASNVYNPVCTISGHDYEVTFTISSRMSQISGGLTVKYNKSKDLVEKTVYGGGARVEEVYDLVGGKTENHRNIYYNSLAVYPDDDTSLNRIYDPKYSQSSSYWKNCMSNCCSGFVGVTGEYAECANDVQNYNSSDKKRFTISSGTLNSLYSNRKQNVYYDVITVLYDDENSNIQNGVEERFFHSIGDALPSVINSPEISGVPSSNNSDMFYGQMDKLNIYKRTAQGNVKVKSKIWNYDLLENNYIKAYSFRKNYDFTNIGVTEQNVDNISISLYQNYLYKKRLKSFKEIDYYENENIETTEYFEYGAAPYYSKIESLRESSDSNVEVLEKFLYPQYIVSPSSTHLEMINRNLTSQILSKERYKVNNGNESFLDRVNNNFEIFNGSSILKSSIEYNKSSNSSEERIVYHMYDDHGNPLEISKADGAHLVYLWGYNDQYPIAKIENTTASEVIGLLGALAEVDETDLTAINDLRIDLPRAMVTTYEYDPLMGVTKITDSKGMETTYHYDLFGRLEFIKDDQGNLLKELKYNYKD